MVMNKIFKKIRNKCGGVFGYAFWLPSKVQIETTVRCNLSCFMCPRETLGFKERIIPDMNLEKFTSIIDKLHKGIGNIFVHGLGEPLLNMEIVKMIVIASRKAPVSLITNGILLNSGLTYNLFHAGLSNITISMDSPYKEVYENIRRGANYDKLVENIAMVNRIIKGNFISAKLIIIMTVSEKNFDSLIDMINLCIKLGVDSLIIKAMHTNCLKKMSEYILGYPEKIKKIKEYSENKKMPLNIINLDYINNKRDKLCRMPWYMIYINCDGITGPCCTHVVRRPEQICNIFKVDFLEAWNGTKIRIFRKSLGSKNKPEMCRNCDYLYQ